MTTTTAPVLPRLNEWQPIETAPRDGQTFLTVNHDGEIWPTRFTNDGRICFRNNHRREPRKFAVHVVDGERLLKEDEEFARKNEAWASEWTLWTRLYEFAPTHWLPIPRPPVCETVADLARLVEG